MRLLLLNPNASAHITARMAASARSALLPGDDLITVTNAQGPPVVRDAATLAQAEAALPALVASHTGACDAIVLGISLDGAVERLRALRTGRPVVGMTEAAVAGAALSGRRVGLVTVGPSMVPLYAERLATLLPPALIGGVAALDLERAFGPETGVVPEVLTAAAAAAQRLDADAIVLAGAVLCGYGAALEAVLGRPVLDGVQCAVHWARALAGASPNPAARA